MTQHNLSVCQGMEAARTCGVVPCVISNTVAGVARYLPVVEALNIGARPSLGESCSQHKRLSPIDVGRRACVLVVDGAAQFYAQGQGIGVLRPFFVVLVGAQDAGVEGDGAQTVLSSRHIAKTDVPVTVAGGGTCYGGDAMYGTGIKREILVFVFPACLGRKHEVARVMVRLGQAGIDGVFLRAFGVGQPAVAPFKRPLLIGAGVVIHSDASSWATDFYLCATGDIDGKVTM